MPDSEVRPCAFTSSMSRSQTILTLKRLTLQSLPEPT